MRLKFITHSGKRGEASPFFVAGFLILGVILSNGYLAADPAPVILAFGDSLTAGYAVAKEDSYPFRLQQILKKEGLPHRVVNGGVSGDTTAGGLRRVRWLMKHKPSIVILELGANDGLRGLSVIEMEKNLAGIIELCQEGNAKILLAGMKIPPNYGEEYSHNFETVYGRLSEQYKIPLLPFFLEGVAGVRGLTQQDGLHPLAPGYDIVARTVWNHLKPLL